MRKLFAVVVLAALALLVLPTTALAQSVGGYGPNRGPGSNVNWYGDWGYPGDGWNGGWFGRGWLGHTVRSGIKLDLDRLPKSQKELALGGYLFIDGNDEGVVDQFDGFFNGILPLPLGPHSLTIAYLGQEGVWYRYDTEVSVRLGRITNVYPRFRVAAQPAPVQPTPQPAPQAVPTPQPAPQAAPAQPTPAPAAQPTCPQGSVGGYGPNSGPCSNVVRAGVGPP